MILRPEQCWGCLNIVSNLRQTKALRPEQAFRGTGFSRVFACGVRAPEESQFHCGFHSVRSEIFIGRNANTSTQLRSEERNSTRISPLPKPSAPPNGAEGSFCSCSIYKHMSPLTG